MVKKAHLSNS